MEFTYLSIGGGFRGSANNGQIFVRLKPSRRAGQVAGRDPERPAREARADPGVRPSIGGARSIFGGFGQPIRINVQGPEPTRLKIAAEQVLETMRAVPGVAEPQSSDEGEIPQLDVRVDRQQAWAAGLGIDSIASTLAAAVSGPARDAVGRPERATRTTSSSSIPTRCASRRRTSPRIPVLSNNIDPRTGQPAIVPLSQVADVRAGVGPQQIERRSLERQISISAGVLPGYSMGDVADARADAIATHRPAPRLSHRVRRRRAEPRRDEGLRARGDPARGGLHLPDPGVAVRLVRAAAVDHARAAALLHRRGARRCWSPAAR